MWDKNPQLQHVMFPTQLNSEILSSNFEGKIEQKLSHSLRKFWNKIDRKISKLAKVMEFQFYIMFVFSIIAYEIYKIFFVQGYETRYRVWFVAVFILAYVHTYVIIITLGLCFVIINLIFNIKQRHIIFRIENFIKHASLYRNLNIVLNKILRHTREMNDYNKFYSKYITAILFCYCFNGCFVLKCSISLPEFNLIVFILWATLGILYFIGIVAFCSISSNTSLLNRRIFLKLQILKISLHKRKIKLSLKNIVYLDLVNEYKTLLHSTGFRITTNTPLDNRLYLFQLSRYIFMIFFKVANKF